MHSRMLWQGTKVGGERRTKNDARRVAAGIVKQLIVREDLAAVGGDTRTVPASRSS